MNAPRALVDGRFADAVEIFSRGLQYGDGVFETILVSQRHLPMWNWHWRRLELSAARLQFDLPAQQALQREVEQLRAGRESGVLKLILARQADARGYASNQRSMLRILLWNEWPADIQIQKQHGIRLQWCQTRIPRDLPHRDLKTLNALPWVTAASESVLQSFDAGLLLNEIGQVIGATNFNLFVVRAGQIQTPSISSGARDGVMRRYLIDHFSISQAIQETAMLAVDVLQADEVFVTNAVRGVVPVVAIGDRQCSIGPITRDWQNHMRQFGF